MRYIPILFLIIIGIIAGGCIPLTTQTDQQIPYEDASLIMKSCRAENVSCKGAFIQVINETEDYVYCAFYDLDLIDLISAINEKDADVKVVLETENAIILKKPTVYDYNSALMPDKFCVSEKAMVTGSF